MIQAAFNMFKHAPKPKPPLHTYIFIYSILIHLIHLILQAPRELSHKWLLVYIIHEDGGFLVHPPALGLCPKILISSWRFGVSERFPIDFFHQPRRGTIGIYLIFFVTMKFGDLEARKIHKIITSGWFFTKPFETYAQVKWDHETPRIGVKIPKNIWVATNQSCNIYVS